MNYIAQINGFWNWRLMNEITHQAVDLYFGILDFANRAGWASPFCIPNSKLVTHCDFTDAAQLSKIRNQLVQLGLIDYAPGKKGQAGKYTIKYLYCCQIDNNNGNNPDNNTGSNTGSNEGSNTATIPTTYINKNININEKDNTPYSPPRGNDTVQAMVDLFHDICKSYPEVRSISDARRKAVKARQNKYSTEQFRELFTKAEASDFLKGANNRNWSANFDWLMKDANFAKTLDGNYDNRDKYAPGEFTAATENISEVEQAFMAAYGGGGA